MYSFDKKTVILKGSVGYPIRAGERATIFHEGGTIRTSEVVGIMQVDFDGLGFETLNTNYYVISHTVPVTASYSKSTGFALSKVV